MKRAKSMGITPIFLDCQSPIIHAKRYPDLLKHIIEKIREKVGQKQLSQGISGSDAEISEKFRSHLSTLLGQVKSKILLIFDEIENISPRTAASPHWNEERDILLFWQNLRSFMQGDADGRVSMCLVGTSPILLEQAKICNVANPMYLFAQKRFLQSFTYDDTKEMVERLGFFMGLQIGSTQIATLQTLYGGHPFFIRQVCSNIHQLAELQRPFKVSDRLLEKAIEKFGGQLDSYLKDILSNLQNFYADEFKLLVDVSNGETEEILEYSNYAPDLIDHLIGYGLIERCGEDFDIKYDSVRRALKRILADEGASAVWKEFSARRNRIETDIRRELLSSSKYMGSAEWENLCKEQFSRVRFQKLVSIEPRKLFSKSDSPLFWSDLINFIESDKVFPYLKERREDILSAMKTVNNKGRVDAHAKILPPKDVSEVKKSFDVLEAEFSQPE